MKRLFKDLYSVAGARKDINSCAYTDGMYEAINLCQEHLKSKINNCPLTVGQLYAIKILHPTVRFVAMDEDGTATAYELRPEKLNFPYWTFQSGSMWQPLPGLNNYADNWEDSLVDVERALA